MITQNLKTDIEATLRLFATKPLAQTAIELFNVLGYHSERRLSLKPNTSENFLNTFAKNRSFNSDQALVSDWRSVDFLFQLTDEEIRATALGDQSSLFESKREYEGAVIESYLFFTVELTPRRYTRTELAGITRAVNRLFSMPVFLFFRHGDTATLAIIRRRLHKRDESRDVLEKVTLIKDVVFSDPIRAHIEIFHDLALPVLYDEYRFHNFVGLHQAWEKRLGSYALNERFYREVAAWYFWALEHPTIKLPRGVESIRNRDEREKQRSIFFIRLLTRLIFCWFLQEKNLIPRDLFRARVAEAFLRDSSPKVSTYYRAFLQNLFFATLNQEQEKRGWRKEYDKSTRKGNRGATNLWRYRDLLRDPAELESLLREHIPFVNGGLFDCLDQVFQEKEERDDIRLDDFSEEKGNTLCLPNEIFFGAEREVDLSGVYDDDRRKREKVRGLIETLSRYKFTVEENTPLEEEIALDPELLGKVFENLLASYNEDTRTTARKALGGYYTPREIVGYMVDEALIDFLRSALADQVPSNKSPIQDLQTRLRSLFTAHPATFANPFSPKETNALIAAIGQIKILDPACGSGAFPMGVLHRLVDLLQKLDPNNESWKRDRLAEAESYCEVLRQSDAPRDEVNQCEARIEDIRKSFDTRYHALDFARKLYIIENSIYGVDIQPIATQIAKLRFFIALIVDQQVRPLAPNLGVRPLPNLETKIVAADALIPLEKPHGQMDLLDVEVRPLRNQLEQVRHDHFNARTPSAKARCRQRDAELRAQLAAVLKNNGLPADEARSLSTWDPYDQNHAAKFFDSEWMFGIPTNVVKLGTTSKALGKQANSGEVDGGFHLVIGNPPYVRIQTLKQKDPEVVDFYKAHYEAAKKGNYDLYVVFVEMGLRLLKHDGQLAYILPHKFFNAQYGEPLRGLIAKGQHLKHVVHFGDQQVFPGATNYVCLLFLSKAGTDNCRFVRVDDLSEWLRTFKGTERRFDSQTINASEWNFAVGRGAGVFEHLTSLPTKLEDLTTRIFQGIKTGADKIYIVEDVGRTRKGIRVFCRQTEKEYELERNLLHPLVKGGDSKAYLLTKTDRLILFPYVAENGNSPALIPAAKLKKDYPLTWAYLEENRSYLEKREDGSMRGTGWYAYSRNQALDVMPKPKLFTPDLAPTAAFSYDATGEIFFTGGVAGGYGILPRPSVRPEFLLAILNSRVVDFVHHRIATQMRGGWFSYESRFIRGLPIANASSDQQTAVVRLVEYLLWLNRRFHQHPESKIPRDALMLGWWEQVLNGLVYELYFPDELRSRNLNILDLVAAAALPDLDRPTDEESLYLLRSGFERTYATEHPLRGALSALRSLEIVRTIEGEP